MHNIDIVDKDDNVIGECSVKEAHEKKLLHRVSVVYLINDKKEILVQERMDDGRFDHSAAGHVDKGETYIDAAKRELKEELGVESITLKHLGKTSSERHLFEVYFTEGEPGKIQEEEVKRVFWANPEDVKRDMVINPEKYSSGFKASIELLSRVQN